MKKNAVYFFVMLLSAAITFHAGAESGRGSNGEDVKELQQRFTDSTEKESSGADTDRPDGAMDPEESEEYNDFLNYIYSFLEYTVSENNDGTLTIQNISTVRSKIIIPEFLDHHKVTVLGEELCAGNSLLDYIELPDSVTTIRRNAFSLGISFGAVLMPSDPLSIEEGAFTNNDREDFTLVVYPDSAAEQYAKDNNIHFIYYEDFDEEQYSEENKLIWSDADPEITYVDEDYWHTILNP